MKLINKLILIVGIALNAWIFIIQPIIINRIFLKYLMTGRYIIKGSTIFKNNDSILIVLGIGLILEFLLIKEFLKLIKK